MEDLPNYGHVFRDMLPDVFNTAKWFIMQNQVWVMMVVAFCVVYAIMSLIAFLLNAKDIDEDDDEDYEYREY